MQLLCFLSFFYLMVISGASEHFTPGQISQMDTADFDVVLNSNIDPSIRQQLADSAVALGRADLILYCFTNFHTCVFVTEAVAALDDSPEKDRLAVQLIKTPSKIWPSEHIMSGSRGGAIGYSLREPFVSLIRKYLPHYPLNDAPISTRAERLKLAEALEDAMAGKTVPAFQYPTAGQYTGGPTKQPWPATGADKVSKNISGDAAAPSTQSATMSSNLEEPTSVSKVKTLPPIPRPAKSSVNQAVALIMLCVVALGGCLWSFFKKRP